MHYHQCYLTTLNTLFISYPFSSEQWAKNAVLQVNPMNGGKKIIKMIPTNNCNCLTSYP